MLKASLGTCATRHPWTILVVAATFWAIAGSADARTWHNKDGRTIEAEFVSLHGDRLTLDKGGKKVTFDVNLLTDEDKSTAKALAAVKNPSGDDDNPFETSSGSSSSGNSSGNSAGKTGSSKPGKKDDDDDADETVSNKVRPWTDVLGNKIVGRFVNISGSTVSIKKRDRNIVPVDYFKLVEEDRRYIANLLEKTGQASLIPKPQAANNVAAAGGGSNVVPNVGPRPPGAPATFNSTPASPTAVGGSPTGTIAGSPMPTPSSSGITPPPGTSVGPNGMPIAAGSPPPTSGSPISTNPGPSYNSPSYNSTPASPYSSSPPNSNPAPFSSSPPSASPAPFSSTPPSSGPPVGGFGVPRMVKVCESCNREVSDQLTAGDTCPHCGVRFDVDRTNGKVSYSSSRFRVRAITGVISLIVIVIGGIGAFFTWLIGGGKN